MRLNFCLFILAFTFLPLSNTAKSQSVVESIKQFDTLSVYSLPKDAVLLFEGIVSVTIIFDDPTAPTIDMPVTTDMKVFKRVLGTATEYYIYETFSNGHIEVSDCITVQNNLPFPLKAGKTVVLFYAGWSPFCPDQLNAVACTDDTFIVRRYNGAIFMKFAKKESFNLNGGNKL